LPEPEPEPDSQKWLDIRPTGTGYPVHPVRLTTSKALSHSVLWPAQFGRKLVLGTRSRPRRLPPETKTRPRRWQFFSRRNDDTSQDRLKTEMFRPRPQPWTAGTRYTMLLLTDLIN